MSELEQRIFKVKRAYIELSNLMEKLDDDSELFKQLDMIYSLLDEAVND